MGEFGPVFNLYVEILNICLLFHARCRTAFYINRYSKQSYVEAKETPVFPPAEEARAGCSSPAGSQKLPGKDYFPRGSALGFSTTSLIHPVPFTRALHLMPSVSVCVGNESRLCGNKGIRPYCDRQSALSVCAQSWIHGYAQHALLVHLASIWLLIMYFFRTTSMYVLGLFLRFTHVTLKCCICF